LRGKPWWPPSSSANPDRSRDPSKSPVTETEFSVFSNTLHPLRLISQKMRVHP
jgi:hypothetical protein